ncbi:XdhC family protein [Desulforhopalus singaporensis]
MSQALQAKEPAALVSVVAHSGASRGKRGAIMVVKNGGSAEHMKNVKK